MNMRKVSLKREVFICCHNSNLTTGGGISGGSISSSFSSIKYFFSRLDHCKNICKLLNLLKQQHIHLCCNKHVTRLMDHCNHLRNTCNKSFNNKKHISRGKVQSGLFSAHCIAARHFNKRRLWIAEFGCLKSLSHASYSFPPFFSIVFFPSSNPIISC